MIIDDRSKKGKELKKRLDFAGYENYNISKVDLEVSLMSKMGRPKIENPKEFKVAVRLTENEFKILKKNAAEDNLTVAQVLRKGIEEMLCERK